MKVTLTSKVRILPDEETRDLLISTMHAYTAACNYVSVHVFSTGMTSKKRIHDELYRDIRSRFALRSQMAESVIRTVVAKYKALSSSGESHGRSYDSPNPSMTLCGTETILSREMCSQSTLFPEDAGCISQSLHHLLTASSVQRSWSTNTGSSICISR